MSNEAHFYIDHAPPEAVRSILRHFAPGIGMNVKEIGSVIPVIDKAKFRSEWPKRLADLGLLVPAINEHPIRYRLSSLGALINQLETSDQGIIPDLLHYLHSGYGIASSYPMYMWSYRQCSQIVWQQQQLPKTNEIAARVFALMIEQFPDLDFQARIGARFDATAVGRWFQWVQTLQPPPFLQGNMVLNPRYVSRYELVVLALDCTYRQLDYRYGDPVLLDERLLDQIASVFFLDRTRCRNLLDVAARMTRLIRITDTFAGTSITLLEPYSIERILRS